MAALKIYALLLLIVIYGCGQVSNDRTSISPKIVLKDTVSDKEIYDFMQVVITEQQLERDNGLSIDPSDRCTPFLDDSAFLTTLLIDTTAIESSYDTSDWKKGRITVSGTIGSGLLNKCLTTDDTVFMLQQKARHLNFKWDNSKLKFSTGNDSSWYVFSIPLFSKDRTKAVLMMEHLCPGLCGTGKTLLYKKENNEWKSQIGNAWWH